MQYTVIQVRPQDVEKEINAMAAMGWRVISQSESKWEIKQCFGCSNTVDSIVNVIMGKER